MLSLLSDLIKIPASGQTRSLRLSVQNITLIVADAFMLAKLWGMKENNKEEIEETLKICI
jgi:hypothetical protein